MRRPARRLFTLCSALLSPFWRWSAHRWVLFALALPTLWVLLDLSSDGGPFPHWIDYTDSTQLDRQALGYNELPDYHERPAKWGGGYFDSYDGGNQGWRNDHFGYSSWQRPYWPDGDPGLGARNPLPPLVLRTEVYAVRPRIAIAVMAVGWLCWSLLFARHCSRRAHPSQRGFEVVTAAAAAEPPAAPPG